MAIEQARVYTDLASLGRLRAQARNDRAAAVDEVARQFESLFTRMMLRSMRDAGFGGGLLDGPRAGFYRDLYDEQLAIEVSRERGLGLAEVIARQLRARLSDAQGDTSGAGRDVRDYLRAPLARAAATGSAVPRDPGPGAVADDTVARGARPASSATALPDGTPEGFVALLRPAAERAAAALGLPPEALIAQAALETGWGRHLMRHPDGRPAYNLFGIKADGRWAGERVQVRTLEYRDGVPVRTRADFRAYGSWQESFDDYVRFVRENPRYREALRANGDPARYFDALQRAGYATDPAYARKIERILERAPLRAASAGEGARAG